MNKIIQLNEDKASSQSIECLMELGKTLESAELRHRFTGVQQNILQEIRGGMCTVEQGYAYLENFEMRLLAEQWNELTKRSVVSS